MDNELIEFIDRQNWIWAKTYAGFAPHWYIVKKNVKTEDLPIYKKLIMATFTSPNKFIEDRFNRKWSCVNIGRYKYWCHAKPSDQMIKDEISVESHVSGKTFELVTLSHYAEDLAVIVNRTEVTDYS
jgi:hypothetical protein